MTWVAFGAVAHEDVEASPDGSEVRVRQTTTAGQHCKVFSALAKLQSETKTKAKTK